MSPVVVSFIEGEQQAFISSLQLVKRDSFCSNCSKLMMLA